MVSPDTVLTGSHPTDATTATTLPYGRVNGFVRLVAILPADSSKEVEGAVEATAASVRFREP